MRDLKRGLLTTEDTEASDMAPPAEDGNEMTSSFGSPGAGAAGAPSVRAVSIGYDAAHGEGYAFPANSITTSKYTVLTFIPRSLAEQFRRIANVYFLLISILMILGTYGSLFDSPLSPFSTLMPLIVVLFITMVKEGLEDHKRHRSDKEVNHRMARVLTPAGTFEQTLWTDVRVGTLVRVEDKEELPADLVLVCSDDEEGLCYVETSNIDGETNLKIRRTPGGLPAQDEAQLPAATGVMQYEEPNKSIHTFQGTIVLNGSDEVPLDASNLLLRGSTVRNTRWVLGVVAYTGPETKIMQNARAAPSKMSKIDITVNKTVQLIFFTQFVLVTASTLVSEVWSAANDDNLQYCCIGDTSLWDPYDDSCDSDSDYGTIADWFTFLILYNNFIPISLYVTLEMINYVQASFINNDLNMYDEEQDTPARARTSNMNADLGQIEYIFSDKTGTLTCNVMNFKRCSIAGRAYGEPTMEVAVGEQLDDFDELAELTRRALAEPEGPCAAFLSLMAVCHTVVAERQDDGSVKFQAESPDEGALVGAAADLGFAFKSRTSGTITMAVEGQELTFEVLAINAFNSTRKRMSIVCRTPAGRNLLLCKGADNIMFDRAAPDAHRDTLTAHLGMFANEGLRTLVLGQRVLSDAELEQWMAKYQAASVDMNDREGMLERAAEELEVNMEVIGATAIEDRLQDGVPDTIATLRAAGIKVWVLTGDKRETAINIGYAARLLNDGMKLITVAGGSKQDVRTQLERLTAHFDRLTDDQSMLARIKELAVRGGVGFGARLGLMQRRPSFASGGSGTSVQDPASGEPAEPAPGLGDLESEHVALVLEGPSLTYLLGDKDCERMLLQLARFCKSVIACRVSPAQKALIVKLVKTGVYPRPMTLAIGDGANDVSMIQTAQVGVGISGKEGRQAVNSADFAIAQFRFLKPLMLVHGRWDYRRISKVVLYSFYKNIVLTLILFYYSFYTGFSGTSLFESLVYSGFNWFVGGAPLAIGLFDRDVNYDTAMRRPHVYMSGRLDMDLNVRVMGKWILHALAHSILLFYLPYAAMTTDGIWSENGKSDGALVFGTAVYTYLIFAMQYKAALIHLSWTKWNAIVWVLSFLVYFFFIVVYSFFVGFAPEFYGVGTAMLRRATFWLLLLLVPTVIVLVDLAVEFVRLQLYPTPIDIVTEQDAGYGAAADMASQDSLSAPAEAPVDETVDQGMLKRRGSWQLGASFRVPEDKIDAIMDDLTVEDAAEMGINVNPQRSAYAFDGPTESYGPGAGGARASSVASASARRLLATAPSAAGGPAGGDARARHMTQ